MLDEATAKGLPKKNIKPYHKIKDFTKPRKKLGCDNQEAGKVPLIDKQARDDKLNVLFMPTVKRKKISSNEKP